LFEEDQKSEYRVVLLEQFLQAPGPIIDVRAPCEFQQGHIPGAVSVPLFDDAGRAHIGTIYKRQGRQAAIMAGLELVGPCLVRLAKTIQEHCGNDGCCRVTCFRGGMRSKSIQWLCQFVGLKTVRLDGGYKIFRREVLQSFEKPFSFVVIGGATGSGKTQALRELCNQGYQTLDFEALANHRGSAFGLLPGTSQPSTEHFENMIASCLWKMNASLPIFVEDESRLVGACAIPKGIFERMDSAPLLWLEVDREMRQKRILEEYGCFPKEWLQEKAAKLHKKLGGQRVKSIIEAIERGDLVYASSLLLEYYDTAYLHSKERRQRETTVVTQKSLLEAVSRF
jgi:tRNA 2-selenouridine synthase